MQKLTLGAVFFCCLSAVVLTWAADQNETMGPIDFFGYKGLDVAKVRAGLPVHEDDRITRQTMEQIEDAVAATIGKKPTGVNFVCCDPKGRNLVYIGLPGETYKPFTLNPVPAGNDQVPPELVSLNRQIEAARDVAVHKGGEAIQEDDSQGYALAKDPQQHALQLQLRDWAVDRGPELEKVLRGSSDAKQRGLAAEALGYARQSPQQMAALLYAMRDVDSTVRNNATRALSVLVESNPALGAQIEPDTIFAMFGSGIWTDHNKAVGLLFAMTVGRDPKLLAKIKAETLEPLIEMARWSEEGHAVAARVILARVGGIPDDKLLSMLDGPPDAIIAAARGSKP